MNIPLRVLIVEDCIDDADLVLNQIRDGGFEPRHERVETAAAMNAALEAHEWDIVIADYVLPQFSGPAALSLIKERGLDLPVIIMSGKVSEEIIVSAMKAGAHDCVLKDNLIRLVPAIKRELEDARARQAQRQVTAIKQERDELLIAIAAQEKIIGIVSHELRTPLAATRIMADFLLTHAKDNIQPVSYLQSIHDEVVRMSSMVDRLLEVGRLNSGSVRWNWETISVARACERAFEAVRWLVNRDAVRLTLDVEPWDLAMNADADAIRRLVLNLTSNAAKFTQCGSIEVRAWATSDDAGSWIQIEVRDTGRGMTPEVLAQLGNAFALNSGVVGEGQTHGVGLGLAICNAIVAAHGGTINFVSVPGCGTKVTVRLAADPAAPGRDGFEKNVISVSSGPALALTGNTSPRIAAA